MRFLRIKCEALHEAQGSPSVARMVHAGGDHSLALVFPALDIPFIDDNDDDEEEVGVDSFEDLVLNRHKGTEEKEEGKYLVKEELVTKEEEQCHACILLDHDYVELKEICQVDGGSVEGAAGESNERNIGADVKGTGSGDVEGSNGLVELRRLGNLKCQAVGRWGSQRQKRSGTAKLIVPKNVKDKQDKDEPNQSTLLKRLSLSRGSSFPSLKSTLSMNSTESVKSTKSTMSRRMQRMGSIVSQAEDQGAFRTKNSVKKSMVARWRRLYAGCIRPQSSEPRLTPKESINSFGTIEAFDTAQWAFTYDL